VTLPAYHSASQEFIASLHALCRDHEVSPATMLTTAREVVALHLEQLSGLPSREGLSDSPVSEAIVTLLHQFRWTPSELNPQPEELSPHLLQTLFEAALDRDNRFHRGIVYTPTKSVEKVLAAGLAELNHRNSTPLRIADPSAGSGAFLVQLATSCPEEFELVGIDPDGAALRVARQRLDLLKATSRRSLPAVTLLEGLAQKHLLSAGAFDMIVGNPPYVRHEGRLSPAEGFQQNLAETLGLARSDKRIARLVCGRADLYATFFVLAISAVRPGGVVAFITSDSWLDTRFGVDLQSIALECCEQLTIHGEPNERAFGAAGVNTVITVMRRRRVTGTTSVHFVPSGEHASETTVAAPNPGKWAARYLRGGTATRNLQNHPLMIPLSSVAQLTYGNKPGIRPFFVLPAAAAPEMVDERFLRPVLASSKELQTYALDPNALAHSLFVCPHSQIELERLGFHRTLHWIRQGAAKKTTRGARHTQEGIAWPAVESVRNNRPEWHCISPRPPGDFVIPSLLGTRLFVAHNETRVDNTNAFFHGAFAADIDPLLGLGLLNSSVTYLLFEVYGRPKGLGGLNLYGPELRLLPIPDPNRLTSEQSRGIIDAFSALQGRRILPLIEELGGTSGVVPVDRQALDNHVFDALGFSPRDRITLYEELRSMTLRRLEKGRK
jgi:hypothetical protein